jgi:hypothetical protein
MSRSTSESTLAAPGAGEQLSDAHTSAGLRVVINALTTEACMPVVDQALWRSKLSARLGDLAQAWQQHVSRNEEPGGFLDEMRSEAPDLDPRVRQLHQDHVNLTVAIDSAQRQVAPEHAEQLRLAPPSGNQVDGDILAVREQVSTLVGALTRHQRRGADILHTAYEVDTGGGD